MQYRELVNGAKPVSALGYGCMRFPNKGGFIDEIESERQILEAIKQGVNYFDTAYFYHSGKSETLLGNLFQKHNLRKKVFIADKLPYLLVKQNKDIYNIFQTQLKRLQTDYIDYYLMHMLDSLQTWQQLKSLGILTFIEEQKRLGSIHHIGFSFHGRQEEFMKILADYDWDFCQIQFNYLDENYQAGLAGLQAAYDKGVGVVIMEPLRGGALANNIPDKIQTLFQQYPNTYSPAQWALRWIFNHKEVSVVLSGMNATQQIEENIHVASTTQINSMSDEQLHLIHRAKEIFHELMKVPCTGCNYCMPCPFGVDIPGNFSEYNNSYFFKSRMAKTHYMSKLVKKDDLSGANLCVNCKKCVKHCPQNIDIPQQLKQVHKHLSNPIIVFFLKIVMRFVGPKKQKS